MSSSSGTSVPLNKIVKPYISLETQLLPKERLYPTPSMNDGLSYEDEFDLRVTGCELIQTSGRLLKLPQTAMAAGQILFHRYFYSKSFVKNNMEYYAMASIYLSSKIEESPRTIRDVINVFNNIKQVRGGKIIKPVPVDQAYYELKNQIIKAERRMLKELGFCVHVKHPHKIILIYLSAMNCSDRGLIQKAWNYMNDSLRTDIFLRYTPETVACACIYLSARELKISLPTNPQWFTIFGADEESLKSISIRLMHLYTYKAKTQEELERIVNSCKDSLNQEKLRHREAVQNPLITNIEDSKGSPAVLDIRTASTTPTSDVSAPTAVVPTTSTNGTTKQQINVMNQTSINQGYHHTSHYHHHQAYSSYQAMNKNNYQQQIDYVNEYTEHNEPPFGRYSDSMKHRHSSSTSKSSHKKHTRRYSRSKSRSRSASPSLSPRHNSSKRHKKRSSRDRNRSRSISPNSSKHKKKKYHHKSKSRDDESYSTSSYDSNRYNKNVLV